MFRHRIVLLAAAGAGGQQGGFDDSNTENSNSSNSSTIVTEASFRSGTSRTTKFYATNEEIQERAVRETGQSLVLSTRLPVRNEDGSITNPDGSIKTQADQQRSSALSAPFAGIMRSRRSRGALTNPQEQDSTLASLSNKSLPISETPLAIEKPYMDNSGRIAATINFDEHPLLAGLDVNEDAIMYGSDPEEFVKNVEGVKKLIINHSRWERSDNRYYWATKVFQFLSVVTAFDILRNWYATSVLKNGYDDFMTISEDDISHLKNRRNADFRKLKEEWAAVPPDFSAILKKSGISSQSSSALVAYHPMDTTGQELRLKQEQDEKNQEALEAMGASTSKVAASPTTIVALKVARRTLMPQSEDFTAIVKEEILEHQRRKSDALNHPDKAS